MISFSSRDKGGLRIDLCDTIYNFDAPAFRAVLAEFEDEDEVEIHIASPGGEVDAAFAMYNALSERSGHVTIHTEGTVASAATLILCASGAKVIAHPGSVFMIHMASTLLYGNAEELKKAQEMLSKYDDQIVNILSARMKCDEKKLRALLADETWLNIDEAKELGLVDEVVEAKPELENNSAFDLNNIDAHVISKVSAGLISRVTSNISQQLKDKLSDYSSQTKRVVDDSQRALEDQSKTVLDNIKEIHAQLLEDYKAAENRLVARETVLNEKIQSIHDERDASIEALKGINETINNSIAALNAAMTESINTSKQTVTDSIANADSAVNNAMSSICKAVASINNDLNKCKEVVNRAYALEGVEFSASHITKKFTLE